MYIKAARFDVILGQRSSQALASERGRLLVKFLVVVIKGACTNLPRLSSVVLHYIFYNLMPGFLPEL